jgi:hypothetical protein
VRERLAALREELGFELEARYREWLPVVEIDGRRASVYHLDEAGFRGKLASQSQPA